MAVRRLCAPLLGALAGLLLLTAGAVLAADQSVTVQGFAFSPSTVTVGVGDSVTWTNRDAAPHTATADDGSFDTGTLSDGASSSVTFESAGTFAYHCEVHPNMTGTVVVQAAAAGGGGGATQPPTDTVPARSGAPSGTAMAFVLALAAISLFLTGRLLRAR